MPVLSDYVSVKRRYSRSVNLERDIEIPDSVIGYIPTSRAMDGIERFLRAHSLQNSVRAWTLTGSYGTGKSAFANYLTALCSPKGDQNQTNAIHILKRTKDSNSLLKQIKNKLPESGLVRAVATAQREPIIRTVIRALNRGASIFWQNARGRKPDVLNELNSLNLRAEKGAVVESSHLIRVIEQLAQASRTGILLIIDELGKNLEFSAQNQSLDDLYLLQQLAELPSNKNGHNIFIFSLLHQSFIDYGHGLASAQRNEWAKIQGRFEDIPFIESSDRMMRLIGHAIDQSSKGFFRSSVLKWTRQWQKALSGYDFSFSKDDLASIYPLHPFSALVLPILCTKYSQNDRTLFTFLASSEPGSFTTYLHQTAIAKDNSPSFKLHKLYDYFVESAGMSVSLRPQFQRWVEIQSRLADAGHLDPDALLVLKTIGILNLISTTGSLKASRKTVALAMCNDPDAGGELSLWDGIIDKLLQKGFLVWRKRIDELRIWEGSDFDIEKELSDQAHVLNVSLADLFNEYFPLRPLVVQRHSYQTGTLRYFERQYLDKAKSLYSPNCISPDSDGLICYWVGKERDLKKIERIPDSTPSNQPVIIVCASELNALKIACHEYVALTNIETKSVQLQTDGVARREVGQRRLYSQRLLEETLQRSFNIGSGDVICYGLGERIMLESWSSLQSYLSHTCDNVYDKGPCLWNELINRRELTPQGAAARNKLIEAMLENAGQPRLGFIGNGPEYSMFESLLINTELYAESEDGWIFSNPPNTDDGIYHVWKAIEGFCRSAKDVPRNINLLYDELEAPPYGAKKGIIPILLLSALLYHNEYVSVYIDGTFIPVLGTEHFELLVKKPERFAVKYFEILGVRAEVFRELGKILSAESPQKNLVLRNSTILSIVKPLVGFIKKLPAYTLSTDSRITTDAKAVRKALLEAKEPDQLLFNALPQSCGLSPITGKETDEKTIVKTFRKKLVQALSSLQTSYDDMLGHCERLLRKAFAIRIDSSEFRGNLRYRAMNLLSQVVEPRLKSLIIVCSDIESDHKSWLESILLIISNKPPNSWTDEDVIIYETKLSDIARRFMNLEALQKEIAIPSEGIDARRITVTYPDGDEIHQMLWIDRDNQSNIDRIAEQIIERYDLSDDANLKQAVTAALIERIFSKRSDKADSKAEIQIKEHKIG